MKNKNHVIMSNLSTGRINLGGTLHLGQAVTQGICAECYNALPTLCDGRLGQYQKKMSEVERQCCRK